MRTAKRPGLVVIGPGRVGRALALALRDAGWPLRAVAGPHAGSLARRLGPEVSAHRQAGRAVARGDAVLLALPEAGLQQVAATLPRQAAAGRIFLHTSGAASDQVLEPLRAAGAATGRLHPLFPFSGRSDDIQGLRGAFFALSGDNKAQALAGRLARSLGGKVLKLPPGSEVAYHLSAVLASNLVVALAAEAARLGPHWGQDAPAALEAVLPLLRAAVGQMERHGLPDALTGPVVRGESAVIHAHLELLERKGDGDLSQVYRLLSRTAVDLALQAGNLDVAQARRLKRLLSDFGRRRKSE